MSYVGLSLLQAGTLGNLVEVGNGSRSGRSTRREGLGLFVDMMVMKLNLLKAISVQMTGQVRRRQRGKQKL